MSGRLHLGGAEQTSLLEQVRTTRLTTRTNAEAPKKTEAPRKECFTLISLCGISAIAEEPLGFAAEEEAWDDGLKLLASAARSRARLSTSDCVHQRNNQMYRWLARLPNKHGNSEARAAQSAPHERSRAGQMHAQQQSEHSDSDSLKMKAHPLEALPLLLHLLDQFFQPPHARIELTAFGCKSPVTEDTTLSSVALQRRI